MAHLRFEVVRTFDETTQVVWNALVDWPAHGEWIPATRVEMGSDDPTAVGAEFTGYTGFGPVVLEDRMRVTRCDWSDGRGAGFCEVDKLGPVLRGRAWFTVEPDGAGTVVAWVEDVAVPYVPRFLAPLINHAATIGFRFSLRRLAKILHARNTARVRRGGN